MRQMMVKKERCSIQVLLIWENGGLLSQIPSPQQDQDKSHGQEFLLQFKVQFFGACRELLSSLSPHPGSLACPQLLLISGLLEPVCKAHTVMGHAAKVAYSWGSLSTHLGMHHQVGKSGRLPPGGHGPCGPKRKQVSTPWEFRPGARMSHKPPSLFVSLGLH